METDGRQEKEPGALPAGVYGPEEIRRGIVDRLLGERMGKPGEVLNGLDVYKRQALGSTVPR